MPRRDHKIVFCCVLLLDRLRSFLYMQHNEKAIGVLTEMSADPAISSQHTAKQRGGLNAGNRESARIACIRAVAMAEMYTGGGKTYAEIGREYGISRERVRQILSRLGVNGVDGAWHIRRAKRRAERVASLDERYVRRSGCGFKQWRQIPKKIRSQYSHKRENVINQYGAQAWAMTQWEYYNEVKCAGIEVSRGGLCMTRIDCDRPFAPGNVKFAQVGNWRKRWKES